MDEFGGSVAGGGRYDKMIGKFTGQDTPACGFSIGFERIVMLLLENGYEIPSKRQKKYIFLKRICTRKASSRYLRWQKRPRSRETGSGGQYEEKQEIPEGSADRRRI